MPAVNRAPHCRCGEQDPARYYPRHGLGTCKACKSRRVAELARAKRAGMADPPPGRVVLPLSRNELITKWIGAVK